VTAPDQVRGRLSLENALAAHSSSLNRAQYPGTAPLFRDECRFWPEKTFFFDHALGTFTFD